MVKKEKSQERNESMVGRRRKRYLLGAVVVLLIMVCGILVYLKFFTGETNVEFEAVKESRIPVEITNEVIPEYRTLERALACVVDEDVYVVVTRGEKPTSGFGVSVDRMAIEDKNGGKNLIVYAGFEDPQKKTAISQIITYPVVVVKTDLDRLPDTIELRIQY